MQGWWQLWVMLGLDPEPWQGWIHSGGVCPRLELLCAAFKRSRSDARGDPVLPHPFPSCEELGG